MARGALPISPVIGPVAAGLVGLAILGPLAAVVWRAGGLHGLSGADLVALRFTVVQAVLSALVSVALAIPVARALSRRRFRGRRAVIALLGAPFLLPVIVAVFALLAVFGRAGLVNDALGLIGLPPVQIYGLHGVVLAHVFLNMPLATRMILQGWATIPAEHFRLAAALGMRAGDVQRRLEVPMLLRVLPATAMVIFAICLSSFAVALTLGGGPRATTLELAIYQAFTFDFDLGKAAALALVQLGLVTLAASLAIGLRAEAGVGAGLDRVAQRIEARGLGLRVLDGTVIALACLFLILPLGAVVLRGVAALGDLPPAIWGAVGNSVLVALAAMALTVTWALALSSSPRHWPDLVGMGAMAASPLVIGTGVFLLVNPFVAPQVAALPVTVLVNALMALPFALRILRPAYRQVEAEYGRLATALGLRGVARLRLLIWPRLRRPIGFAAGLSAALSAGDLGVIALFSAPEQGTLPLYMYRLMGAYRTDAAAAAALLLLALSFGLFILFDRGGGRDADA